MAFAALSQIAVAALGEPEATVAADAEQLAGSIKSMPRTNYQVHEIALPSGTRLREFVSPAGIVFAVVWSGPTLPNLRQTLGSYFDAYVEAAKAHRALRRQVQIQQDDLVVESSGHMRAFSGRAYLPKALPAGTSVEDIR